MRLQGAINLYLNARRAELAPITRRGLGYTLDRFARSLGEGFALKALKRKHIEEWIGQYRTAARAGVVLSAIRVFTAWCVDTGMLRGDPCAGIKGPRRPRLAPRELTLDETIKVFAAIPDSRARVIVSLAFHEGLRRGEVGRLEIADIDRHKNLLHIIGKGGHERFVALSRQTRAAIDAYLGEWPIASGALVRSYTHPTVGLHPSTITLIVTEIMRAAGIKERPWDGKSAHAGRHTWAGALLDNGADIRAVSSGLGHASIAPTLRYLMRRQSVEDLRPFQPNYEPPPVADEDTAA